MNNTLHHNYQNGFPKWLLATVLVLSFFTFSGWPVQSQIKQTARQTTLLVNNPVQPVKSITLTRAIGYSYNNSTTLFFVAPAFNLIYLHSRLTGIIIKNHSRLVSNRSKTGFFYHIKTIPQNTGDLPVPELG
jgi:hypothetical protein